MPPETLSQHHGYYLESRARRMSESLNMEKLVRQRPNAWYLMSSIEGDKMMPGSKHEKNRAGNLARRKYRPERERKIATENQSRLETNWLRGVVTAGTWRENLAT